MEREEEMGEGGGKDKNSQERNGQLRGIKRRYISCEGQIQKDKK